MPKLLLSVVFLAVTASASEPSPALDIDAERVTVSGLSAGGQMAHQLHIAYSDIFSGAGIIAGGPFGCAKGSLATAFARCVSTTGGDLPPAEFIEDIRSAEEQGLVSATQHLQDDRVWVFHGSLDRAVAEGLSDTLEGLYAAFIPEANIVYVKDVPAAHNFPAEQQGHPCGASEPPFVGNCAYDAAGELLQQLYPGLEAPTPGAEPALSEVALAGAAEAGLNGTAYLYVPGACVEDGASCALHLVLHGCAQSSVQVGTAFIEQSGYLPWAEANQIVLAFPQVVPSAANPLGCWDWWGYTGANYRWRDGAQMKALANWVATMAASP
jgi:hypothetical protein